ncbi:hypothetical protein [Verrucomicrobium sp. BvORR034]|uniref:hypothetical protein n=1 Tax=Verrucomicrobium sp. BvORR034 TaxID=1396418 RepID=UPI000679B68E|nr:hypothetical protein [Verrucomicrobium sp. BvORR034]
MISVLDSAEGYGGLYSFREVASYLHVPVTTLRSWFRPYGGRKPIIKGQVDTNGEEGLWLNFNDFIQASVIHYLKSKDVNAKALREALEKCKTEFGLDYPLSERGHRVFVDDAGDVVILPPGEENTIQLTGPYQGHRNLHPIMCEYLDRLEFDKDGHASKWVLWKNEFDGVTKRVVMDPSVNFGEPTVEGTVYRASTLRDAAEAEGGAEHAARIYEVDVSDVVVAVEAFRNAPELRKAA